MTGPNQCDEPGCVVRGPLSRMTPNGYTPAVFMCKKHAGIDYGKTEGELEAMQERENVRPDGSSDE